MHPSNAFYSKNISRSIRPACNTSPTLTEQISPRLKHDPKRDIVKFILNHQNPIYEVIPEAEQHDYGLRKKKKQAVRNLNITRK